MPTCEMCGAEESNLTPIRVSHAELEVCDGCSSMGTKLESDSSANDDSSDTKYSTSDSASNETPPTSAETGPGPASREADSEMVSSLVPDYADRIREGRNQSGLTVDELADRINEKASYIRKIERGEMQPDTTTQMQLEQFLNIELAFADDDTRWMSDSYQQQYDTK